MKYSLAGAIVLASFSGCVSVPEPGPLVPLTHDYIVGTWSSSEGDQTFLSDGTYCESAPGSSEISSRGKWKFDGRGSITLDIAEAREKWQLSSGSDWLYIASIPKNGELFLGVFCVDCAGGMVGEALNRSRKQRADCKGVVPPAR